MVARRPRCARRTKTRSYRPVVEALEDRIQPSRLGLAQLGAKPDVTSGILNDLSYSQLGNNANPFHYDSVPLWITLPDGSVDYISDPSDGSFATTNLDLLLNNNGYLSPGGGNDFSITGNVTLGAQTYDGTLLTARPVAFGYADSFTPDSGEFEVQMQITGGQLAAPSNAAPNPFRVGDDLGLLIHQPNLSITSFPQTFSFSSLQSGNFDGTSDTLNIPAIPPPVVLAQACNCGCPNQPGSLTRSSPSAGGNVPSNTSAAGVNYSTGDTQVVSNELSSDGFGMPWGQTISWTNGLGYAARGDNGNGIVDTQTPYLLPVNGPNTIAEIANGTTAEYFDLVNGAYQPRFFDQSTLTYDSGSGEYTLTDESGDQLVFWGFSPAILLGQQGQFQSFTDPGGNTTAVTARTPDGRPARVQRSSTSGGHTVTESWVYGYVPDGVNAGLLQNVTLERQTDGGPQNVVRQVAYTYYDGTQPYGNPGDLMLAQVEDANGAVLDTSYYRFYTEADAGTVGYIQGLQYYFSTDSYARLVTAVGNPFTVTAAQVAPYADDYFQYDDQQRVTEAVIQGQGCTACSGGLGTYTYSYTASGNPAGYNSWSVKTVEALPDGNQNTVYSNFAGEPMLQVYQDTTTGQQWETFYQYDSQGRVTLTANPSAVTGYDDSHADLLNGQGGHYQYLSDHSGLITRYDYYTGRTATETTPGGVTGYQYDTQLEQGQLGTPIPQETYQYYTHTANGISVNPLATDTVYRNTDGTGGETTTYTYTFYNGTVQTQSMTTTAPVISAAQNGPGVADQTQSVYDAYGREVWDKDADGYLTYTAYDPGTGAVVESITDVNTANTGDFSNLPSGWRTPPGGGLNLVTTYQVDGLGRTVEETRPNGNVTYTVYDDPNHEYRVYPGWNTATGIPTGPTEVYRYALPGSYRETLTMSAAPHLTNGVPDGTEPISGLQTLERDYTNAAGQMVRRDQYFNLSGLTYSTAPYIGAQNTNYYTTQYSYDHRGRLERTQEPTGTITRDVYDGLGRLASQWVGTNDTPASGFWSPTNPAGTVQTSGYVYDNGGVGDGNLTQETDYPGKGVAPRVTQDFYDWRNRKVAEKDGVQANENDGTHRPVFYDTYDNLGEVTSVGRYDGDGVTIQTTNGVPQPPAASLLRAYSTSAYDGQGRVYQTSTYSVNPTTGAVSSAGLTINFYYDHRGDRIGESAPGGLWTKDAYDGAGRLVTESTTDGGGGTSWMAASGVANDIVLEQVQTIYDGDSNATETIDRQRFDNASGTGALGGPNSTTAPQARVYYTDSYYDAVDRLTTTVNVGTNGGAAYSRPSTPPAPSDTVLEVRDIYDAAGRLQDTIDPRGIDTRTFYDGLGRVTETIGDYTNGTPTNASNYTTAYTYDGDGHVLSVTAVQPAGTPSQTTQYVYGVTRASGSAIDSNDLRAATLYPDPTAGLPSSSPSQRETYTYNALGQMTSMTDRNGTTHSYGYDVLGRQPSDTVTALGAGVNGSVRRIDTAYDGQGNPYLFTSYADTAGTTIVNQAEDAYNGLGQLTGEYQSHSGPVVIGATPEVQYTYNDLANGHNNSRPTGMVYPNGRVLTYNYDAGLDDRISRLSSISDSSGVLEAYTYLGLGTVVERAHPQTGVNLTYISPTGSTGDAGDQYTGLDGFGRVAEQLWLNTNTNAVTDDFQYTYDQDGNVFTRNNGLTSAFNEQYTYDNSNQVMSFTRGTHTQSWSYDALGNWNSVTTDGTTQTRTANAQNEYTSVSGATTPTYDNNGNLTTDANGNTYVYDAWNRLVAVRNGSTTLETYSYDALNRRITENTGTPVDLYYNTAWQVIEEQVAGSSTGNTQYVWCLLLSDTLVERDSNPNGSLPLRLYAQQDANGNITALVDTSGSVVERFVYDPFGAATALDPSWSGPGSSLFGWRYLFQGLRYDATIGLYYARNRDYSPTLGRWLQQDPIRFQAGDLNLYRMEFNRPATSHDPTGKLAWWVLPCALGAAVGVGTAIVSDVAAGKAEACHTTVAALLNALLGCASGVLLGSLTKASLFLVDALRALGFEAAATAMWQHPQVRQVLAGAAGVSIGTLSALTDVAATAICDELKKRLAKPCPAPVPPRTMLDRPVPPTCFVAGTLVHTAKGLRRIEEIEPGERVLAWNELSCEYEYDAVGKLIRGVKTDLVELRGEGWTVRCSCEHPFLLADRTWRTADALKEGDHLMAEAARSLRVLSFRRLCLSEGVEVYNFGVSRTHTYCVTERAIVVHNKLVY
jgi:RHS repeat-associated protein